MATRPQNEVDRTNILAPGFVPAVAEITFFPPSPFFCGGSRGGCTTIELQATRLPLQRLAQLGSRIQLQQRNCSRFSRDFLRRPTFSSSQRTGSRNIGLRWPLQDLFGIILRARLQ